MFQPNDPWSSLRWLPVKNVSGVDMPPFALVRVTGVNADGTIEVNKPDTDGKSDLVNGPTNVPNGLQGQATADSPAVVLYDSASGTPAAGDEWGAAAGSWKTTAGKKGWKVYGGATAVTTPANSGLVLAAQRPAGGSSAWCFGPFLSGYDCVDNGDGTFTPSMTWSYAHYDGSTVTVNTTPCP